MVSRWRANWYGYKGLVLPLTYVRETILSLVTAVLLSNVPVIKVNLAHMCRVDFNC